MPGRRARAPSLPSTAENAGLSMETTTTRPEISSNFPRIPSIDPRYRDIYIPSHRASILVFLSVVSSLPGGGGSVIFPSFRRPFIYRKIDWRFCFSRHQMLFLNFIVVSAIKICCYEQTVSILIDKLSVHSSSHARDQGTVPRQGSKDLPTLDLISTEWILPFTTDSCREFSKVPKF